MTMDRDEFKEAMRQARIKEEVEEAMREDPDFDMDLNKSAKTGKNVSKTAKTATKREKTSEKEQKTSENGEKTAEKKPGARRTKASKAAKDTETAKDRRKANATEEAKDSKTVKGPKAAKASKVAAGQDIKKADEIMAKTVKRAMSKAQKRKEALQAAVHVMTNYTDGLQMKADKLSNMADIYKGYISTLEEMTE